MCLVLSLAAAAIVALPALAAEVPLNVVQYPEKRSIEVPFTGTGRGSTGSSLRATVKSTGARTAIEIDWRDLQPALVFGGKISVFVLWGVTRDGTASNLGELFVKEASGSADFQTSLKEFAMILTAEPLPRLTQPSELVLFVSGPVKSKYAKNSAFSFSAFEKAAQRDLDAMGSARYVDKEPLELAQALRAFALAKEAGAEKYDPRSMEEAATTLAQASNLVRYGGSAQAMVDYSRRTVALAGTAVATMAKAIKEKAAAETAGVRKAELEALSQEALTAERNAAAAEAAGSKAAAKAATLGAQKSQLETQMAALAAARDAADRSRAESAAAAAALSAQKAQLETQMAALAAEKAKVQRDHDALAQRLSSALSRVAETTKTARGLVVNLPDILFDTGRSTLKARSQITLAKLAGVISVFPDLNLRIEGHTDSTGGAALNDKLSKNRALSVFAFLKGQGVAESRMKHEGYASKFPAASNVTKAGRAKNRRVEVVLAEGEIKAPTR
jgi:outer membrane protein OmpA-like peptidoglycan-associated protein